MTPSWYGDYRVSNHLRLLAMAEKMVRNIASQSVFEIRS
jgi:hypothetical protein